MDKPDPNNNVTYQAFSFADEAIARQQGRPTSTQLRDAIVNLYETFGGMMVAVNENPVSRMRYNNYMSGLRAQLSGDTGFSAASPATAPKPASKPAAKPAASKAKTKKEADNAVASIPVIHSGEVIGNRKSALAENVLTPGKYKGIHHVKGQPETISPYGSWTIDVPDGFSYTMDPDCAGSSMMGDHYALQIQTTEDCDFSAAYGAAFGLTIYPTSVVWVNIDDGGDNLLSQCALRTLDAIEKKDWHNFTELVHTPDILVKYDDNNRDEECITINFQIICAGDNAGAIGQIDVQGPDMEHLEKKALEMLASVGTVRREFGTGSYEPFFIAPKVQLEFSSFDFLEIAPSVRLPVPDGYKSTDDLSRTGGRSFIICPKDYPFSNDPMQATVGISGARGEINLPEGYQFGEIYIQAPDRLPPGTLTKDSESWFLKISDHCAAYFQENRDDDESKRTWALYRIMLFAGKQGFILTMRINFGKTNVSFQAASIDARNIVRNWLSHIVLEGDTGRKKQVVPVKKPVKNQPVPEQYHAYVGTEKKTGPEKDGKKELLIQGIRSLEKKRDSASGLFAGMKRKKIQAEIDMLKEELRKL